MSNSFWTELLSILGRQSPIFLHRLGNVLGRLFVQLCQTAFRQATRYATTALGFCATILSEATISPRLL